MIPDVCRKIYRMVRPSPQAESREARAATLRRKAERAARAASDAYRELLQCEWGSEPTPEFFDHHIDLFHQWLETRNPLWVERGVYGGLALRGGDVLELCCGDGFNAKNFYSIRCRRILACDFDPEAIRLAQGRNTAPNVEYLLADIRRDMPAGRFDNVIWDAAIEHFTPEEIETILRGIKDRLGKAGVLSGYTIVERAQGKSLHQHEYEFKSKEDLLRFLTPWFQNVTVFETIYPSRHNLYFWASDGPIPFHASWPAATSVTAGAKVP